MSLTEEQEKDIQRIAKKLTLGDSEAWLRDFCARSDVPRYEEVIAAAVDQAGSESIYFGTDAHGEIPDVFWDHLEAITGERFDGVRATHFSCSC